MAGNGAGALIKRGRPSSDMIKHFNASNAKILSLFLVLGLLGYHGLFMLINGLDNCTSLVEQGHYQGNHVWQPNGCMTHTYSHFDTTRCLRYASYIDNWNHFVFIGDSRIRQLYFELLEIIDPHGKPSVIGSTDTERNVTSLEKAHQSLTFNVPHLGFYMSFYWIPILNESVANLVSQLSSSKNVPKILVAGSGTWEIKLSNGSQSALESYISNLHLLSQAVSNWPNNSSLLLWKLQDSVSTEQLSDSRKMITNKLLHSYNTAAVKVLKHSRFQVWFSAHQITEGLGLWSKDGMHIDPVALKHQLQVLLNIYCNNWMAFDDGTCCRSAEPTTTLQMVTLFILFLCFSFTAAWLVYRSFRCRRKQRFKSMESEEVDSFPQGELLIPNRIELSTRRASEEPNCQSLMTSLGKLGLIMAYFYLCDRTNFFMKENKYYSHMNFWLPIGYVFALGIFFNDETRSSKFLNRDQTDEWKGWMQLIILIYHMTGASQIIPLYMHIRVLVSSYLFLTAYGHFCFFWNGASVSFVRLCQVLFRMNFMTVVICLCMNRSYQSYYFVPLVSFWYVVVYVVLALPPKANAATCQTKSIYYFYIIVKFICLFAVITVLYMSEVLFENIFLIKPWRALFVTSDDRIHEWWFRWSLDRYSILFGMLFALAYCIGQKYVLLDESPSSNLWGRNRLAVVVFTSILGITGYAAFTFTCRNKPECNDVHSYVAFVPIVSFILLRNVWGSLRMRFSSFFAWFGRISLELFIGQYHIWLAADTHGVLVLVPNYPVLNVIVTSYILVCIAHEFHQITSRLVAFFVPSDWKRTLRNVVIFFLVLVPIAIHDGMF